MIKEFYLQRYGPVRERRCILSPGFNLLRGDNEDGKTLTVDALVKLLLGRESNDFEGIQRVEEKPEGYIILEEPGGREYKLPEQGTLQQFAGLTAGECRNIFIIRNSNLFIHRDGDFYTAVTDRLTGLRTAEIAAIRRGLQEIGRLTPQGALRNTGEEKLKDRVEAARALRLEIDNLLTALRGEGYDWLEEEQAAAEQELQDLEHRLEALERARKGQTYHKARAALGELRRAGDTVSSLRALHNEDERRWADAARDSARLAREREALVARLAEREKDRVEVERDLCKIQEALSLAGGRRKIVEEQLRPELHLYESGQAKLARQESQSGFFSRAAAAASALLGLSLLGVLMRPQPFFFTAAAVFALGAALAWLSLYRLAWQRGALAAHRQGLQSILARCGLSGDNAVEIRRGMRELEEKHAALQAAANRLHGEAELLAREAAALRNREIPGKKREEEATAGVMAEIGRRSGCEHLADYSTRLREKEAAERTAGEKRSVLESLFGSGRAAGEPAGPADLRYWEQVAAGLEPFAGAFPGPEYTEQAASALKAGRERCAARVDELQQQMEAYRRRLEEVEREVNHVLQQGEAERLYCQTTVDLEAARETLAAFCDSVETARERALCGIAIFDEIAAEEKARVADLFGASSPVTRYFAAITGGLYREVCYDRDAAAIRVERGDGALFETEKLSGGTCDQLYLSIRLALGEKLLRGGRGFFILDDPFIKSDPARLRRQLETLLDLAGQGWQVLYFTAKGEVEEILLPHATSGRVHLTR